VLSLFLLLEQVQEAFYREALETAELEGELRKFASAVAEQESRHVEFLTRRLGAQAQDPPRSSFGAALSSAERFRDAAIQLEEAALATYVGQAPRLTGDAVRAVGTLVSVEARQAAWIRDLAGMSPAPHAADPARKPDDVLADLRSQGFIA
jgi:rubrerythrin